MSVNKVIVLGRLGQDPELKHTSGGMAVTNFSLATNEYWVDKQGQKQERTEWHRIVVWGKQAELCGQYLAKGRQVYLEGKIQTRSWEDNQGQKRYTTEIVANVVRFLGSANETSGASYSHAAAKVPMDSPPSAPSMPSATSSSSSSDKSNSNLPDQSYNVSTDANFTADDVPF